MFSSLLQSHIVVGYGRDSRRVIICAGSVVSTFALWKDYCFKAIAFSKIVNNTVSKSAKNFWSNLLIFNWVQLNLQHGICLKQKHIWGKPCLPTIFLFYNKKKYICNPNFKLHNWNQAMRNSFSILQWCVALKKKSRKLLD